MKTSPFVKKLVFVLSLCLAITTSFSQSVKKLKKQANKLYKNEHYLHALPLFEKIVSSESENADAIFKQGVCLLNTFKKREALDLMLKAQKIDPEANIHMNFWLGLGYHSNMEFEKSNEYLKKYKESLGKNDSRREDCDLHIKHNNLAINYVGHPSDYYIKNLGSTINSYHAEHSPVISKDGKTLIFTARNEISTGHKEAPDGDYFEDIEQSELNEDGTWTKPHSIGKSLNSSGHDASIQLYDNDTKLLLYKATKGGDFYFSSKGEDGWQSPERIKELNTASFESDAHITQDGNTMYFSSNRDTRDGNLDLYVARKTAEGVWGEPTPITELNTDFDEDSPFLTADGQTLYFSTRGRNSMGGYDIYKSEKVGDKWGTPENLGYPVNSPDDDTYYFMAEDGKSAYMSSFRLGGLGDKDIYIVRPIPNVLIVGEVIDTTGANKGKPIADVVVTFTNALDSSITVTDSTYSFVTSEDSLGNVNKTAPEETGYNVNVMASRKYLIQVMKGEDTLFTEEYTVEMVEDEGVKLEKNFYLAYTDSSEMMLASADSNIQGTDGSTMASSGDINWKINDIHFDFDKSNVKNSEIPELANIIKVMSAYPDMALQLRVIGHTDSKGSAAYNLKLSKRRALAAINYLVKKGIERERMILDYKGEEEPKVPNTLPNGEDNPEGRKINRRVEFRFVDKTK